MEDLLAYAYVGALFDIGSMWQEYEDTLHRLFLENPESEFLLHLESLCADKKETVLFITNHTNFDLIDDHKFGKKLMSLLKPIYQSTDIRDFGKKYTGFGGTCAPISAKSLSAYFPMPTTPFHGVMSRSRKICMNTLSLITHIILKNERRSLICPLTAHISH